MRDGRQAMAIRFEEFPRGPLAKRALNDVSVEYRSLLDSERLLVMPEDIREVRERLEDAGFLVSAVDRVDLTQEEAWLLLADGIDDLDMLDGDDDDDFGMDFDVLDDDVGTGPRF